MARITLSSPVALPARTLREIALREPGKRATDAMASVRLPAGFTDAQTIRFASRLSGLSESNVRRLGAADLAKVKAELEDLYATARRRQAARLADAEGEK